MVGSLEEAVYKRIQVFYHIDLCITRSKVSAIWNPDFLIGYILVMPSAICTLCKSK